MIVAGGTYHEECVYPRMDTLLGSGGRAVIALRSKTETEFHTFFPDDQTIRLNFGEKTVVHRSNSRFSFRYLHPLATPLLMGQPTETLLKADVSGGQILRFGCVEGQFKVNADMAVYDPQGSGELFAANGSQAERLVIVLNEGEAAAHTGSDRPDRAALKLLETEGAEAIVIKRGAAGCLVLNAEGEVSAIPAFRTERVFKIGSGDIFSAAFAYAWMNCGMAVEEAANTASANAALYVESRNLLLTSEPSPFDPVSAEPSKLAVAVVSDQQTTLDHWLAWEAKASLENLGARNVQMIDYFERNNISNLLRGIDAIVALPQSYNGMAMDAISAGRIAGIPIHVFCDDRQSGLQETLKDEPVYNDLAGCIYNSLWH